MREAIGLLGRALITLGILVLGFVGYQLWGTSWFEARAQSDLKSQFEAQLATAPTTTTAADPEAPPEPPPPPPEPVPGDAVAIIRIPKIGVDRAVVSGIGRDDLRKGPGHYPTTPLPGQIGNAAIAGHRTTYGAPFFDLGELEPGDLIEVQTTAGLFTYSVTETFVVKPTQVEVLAPTPTATLTLTTCHPKYSAAERLIVKAELVPEQSATPTEATPVAADTEPGAVQTIDEEGLSGDPGERGPTLLWLSILAAVGAAWWLLFHRYHRWWTWFAGAVPFAVVLFVFYSHVERLLPANY